MPIVIETEDEFRARHGDSVYSDQSELFEDGAVIVERTHRIDPPSDKAMLTKAIHRFVKAKIDDRTLRFTNARESVKTQAEWFAKNFGPAPHPKAVEALQGMANEIIELRLRLDDLDAQLPTTKTNNVRESIERDQVAASAKVINAIRQLPTF